MSRSIVEETSLSPSLFNLVMRMELPYIWPHIYYMYLEDDECRVDDLGPRVGTVGGLGAHVLQHRQHRQLHTTQIDRQ